MTPWWTDPVKLETYLRTAHPGETVWLGDHGYRRTTRGDWVEIASGPQRYTSTDLVRIYAPTTEE